MSVTACLNGRHWLERQLLAESVPYVKDGNCFPFIADLPRAQQLLDEQLRTNWPVLLDGLLDRNCPTVRSALPSRSFRRASTPAARIPRSASCCWP